MVFHESKIVDPSFPIRLIINNDPFDFPPHWHEEIELIYILSGTCEVGLNNRKYQLNPGDILIIGSGDVHYFSNQTTGTTCKKIFIQFGLTLFEHHNISRDRKFVTPFLSHTHQMINKENNVAHKEIEKNILEFVREYKEKDEAYGLFLKARLYDIVALLLRYVPQKQYSSCEKNEHTKQLERLDSVFAYVEENFCHDISLDDISKVASFSVYHFTRFFKKATGMTFNQYLSHYRIKNAEYKIINTNKSITDIAYESGFNSLKSFNRNFRKIKGSSPTEYKKAIFGGYKAKSDE